MKFSSITVVDGTRLHDWALERLQKLSETPLKVFTDYPEDDEVIIERIRDAEAIFVSWSTRLEERHLKYATKLKYVGMCCSLYDEASANVDIPYCREHGIEVRGIRDYGDEGVAEFLLSTYIYLAKGLGGTLWREEPIELNSLKIGIIGMGTTGQLVADKLSCFNADIYYYNRSRKPNAEEKGYTYLDLPDLLKTCDIISLHLPRNTKILGREEFKMLGSGKILANISMSLPFDEKDFEEWLEGEGNFAIFDALGAGPYLNERSKSEKIIISPYVSGWTREAKVRLSKKVLENVEDFCK